MAQEPRPQPSRETSWVVDLSSLAATEAVAQELVGALRPGDLVTLSGDLGSGKTTLARAMIRALLDDATLEVPSPTYTLMQVYDAPGMRVVHADLYRIKHASELVELGWDEAADGALVLVEWPDRAGSALAPDRMDLALILEPEEGAEHRVLVVTGHGSFAARVQTMKAIDRILDQADWRGADRAHVTGDAGHRVYERLARGGETAIMMISPPAPDGPPIRMGKSYSTIARLAENVTAFVAMAGGLAARGFSAPAIRAADLKTGLLIIEDFGDAFIAEAGAPVPERYEEATALLAKLHGLDQPATLPVAGEADYTIQPYDLDALLIEVELLPDWYLPHIARKNISSSARATFVNLWRGLLSEIVEGERSWTLRDYHSPNLMWLPEREGTARIGLLDFQDAVIGHPAYDVVSLLQDARVTVDPRLELQLLTQYARARQAQDGGFDLSRFATAYAALGAQRATKILGIFTRLQVRDGKSQYLEHLPRVEQYLLRCLAHPDLAALKAWYEQCLPILFEPPAET